MLGEQRSAAYERSQDEAFREFVGAGRALNVPLDSTVKAWEIRQMAETAAHELRATEGMAPEQRREALDAMRRETQQAITAVVGASVAESFFNNDRGWARTVFSAKETKR